MFSFPAFHCAEKQFRCTNADLWNHVRDGIEHHGWVLESESSDEFQAKVGLNSRSMGERITIVLVPRSILRATSKCVLPIQCIDFGKNHQNISDLFGWISNRVRKLSARQAK